MNAGLSTTVGWCPGALRPMESGDGLILRVKPRGGVLDFATAEALANLARTYGNGFIDLTGRANLQIRGVTAASVAPLTQGLAALGLLDPSARAEAVRNIVVSPLAGLDERAPCDIRPMVEALEVRLAQDEALHDLPPKWSIVVDDGGAFPVAGLAADLRFEAVSAGLLRVSLADATECGFCASGDGADVAVALCKLTLDDGQPKRMRALVEARGARAVLEGAGLSPVSAGPRRACIDPAVRSAADLVGWRDRPVPLLGLAPPFASLRAGDLLVLVDAARRASAHDLRLTPWRALLVTGVDQGKASGIVETIADTDLITKADDPRLRVATCAGAPACRRATTHTHADAAELARSIEEAPTSSGIAIHVSGCAKGCARAAGAPWTLIGRDGRYDLVRNGTVRDVPLARGLSFNEAATWISRDPGARIS